MSVAHVAELIVVSLLVGAVATSYAEYRLKYNLYDYIVEGVKKALGFASKAEAAAKDVVADVKEEVQVVEKKL